MRFLKKFFKKELFKNNEIISVDNEITEMERQKRLIELAEEKGYTILVGNQKMIDIYNHKTGVTNVVGFAKNYTKHLDKLDLSNGVLIDESVEPDMIDILKSEFNDIKIRGGYTRKVD